MDKSWINLSTRANDEYINGVVNFLDFAFAKSDRDGKILCPCTKCVNTYYVSRAEAFDHIICKGFLKGYVRWIFHGESPGAHAFTSRINEEEEDLHHDMHDLLNDAFRMDVNMEERTNEPTDAAVRRSGENQFYSLIKEAEENLYSTCTTFSKLSFMVHLYHIKCLNGWSNKSFTSLLELLKDALPEGNTLPKSFYEFKKIISALGLGYKKIHTCPNDCMLFWKDKEHEKICSKCGASRWKETANILEDDSSFSSKKKKPAKILRWFPLKPRLQRLFMSSKTATFMKWHEEGRIKDGKLRHPADSECWKTLDARYPDFSSEPRNIRLGLACDGFNPFKTMNVTHSTWPVLLIPYNLPPWMCMKQPNFILSLLIPGPKGPGNNIDVYMAPMIEELKELWEDGIETFDASMNEIFRMRAAILWTINDFPAYANLSGWSTKGAYACPVCGYDTASRWLTHSRKHCYMCHRRWLEPNHCFREDWQSFDGTCELRSAPITSSGSSVLRQLEALNNIEGPWKKKSIMFSLPYWEHLLLRHNLDVMHIEKNVSDNILGTLIGQEGKSKDNYKARLDLEDMGIRSVLHPKDRLGSNKKYLPKACYQMTSSEKDSFLRILKELKIPDEYSCNLSRCVQLKQRKLIGLKSYESHLLIQEFLPIAIRGSLPDNVASVIIDLCHFFKELCSKVLDEHDLESLASRIVTLLCEMEKIFPPSFFTIMVHLLIHLPSEGKIAGPVIYRWMYPIERFLFVLKSFVRNKAHPEGSIAEGYLAQECMTFCSRYLVGVETKFTRPIRNNEENDNLVGSNEESIFKIQGRPLGKKSQHGFNVKKRKRVKRVALEKQTLEQAHRYVLFNCDEVTPFREEHKELLRKRNRASRLSSYEMDKLHCRTFSDWFCNRVARLIEQGNTNINDHVKCLAHGPEEIVRRYTGYLINGYRFHTKEREKFLKTQNSGVVVTAKAMSYATARDKQPIEEEVNYFGALTDIIQLQYSGRYNVVLFKCDWIDINRGCKKDNFGVTLVNFTYLTHKGDDLLDDPFVLASQVKKVFYIKDEKHRDWFVVSKCWRVLLNNKEKFQRYQ